MEEKKRAWTYCRIDAPEDQHGCLKGQKKNCWSTQSKWALRLSGNPRIPAAA